MELYYVDIYTDLNESLTIIVNANSYEEAASMVECGEADCIGQIVVSCSAYQ